MAAPAAEQDPKKYYGYLFAGKEPTKVLDALLRGIANYIIDSVGDKDVKTLMPSKMAAFYKAVGGNYDSLFVESSHSSISYVYQSIGCQHTLQPTDNDYAAPSVPALTPKGFVRWQSIEILLCPEEHVGFMQRAVRNFAIKHPDTGEAFPTELPAESLPSEPDQETEAWHEMRADQLKTAATPAEEPRAARERPSDDPPPRTAADVKYTHVKAPRGRSPDGRKHPMDYFNFRHMFTHVPPRRPAQSPSPEKAHAPAHANSPRFFGEIDPRQLSNVQRQAYYRTRRSESSTKDAEPRVSPERVFRSRFRRSSPSSSESSSSDDRRSARSSRATSNTRRRQSSPMPAASPTPPMFTPSPQHAYRPRENAAYDSGLDLRSARRASYAVPVDHSGKLSAPFMQAQRIVQDYHQHTPPRSNSSTRGAAPAPTARFQRGTTNESLGARRRSLDLDALYGREELRRRDHSREGMPPGSAPVPGPGQAHAPPPPQSQTQPAPPPQCPPQPPPPPQPVPPPTPQPSSAPSSRSSHSRRQSVDDRLRPSEREYERDRARERRSRSMRSRGERDRERDREKERDRDWERNRERERERERERDRDRGRDRNRTRERERDGGRERARSGRFLSPESPLTGVDGRRYPV